MKKALFLICFVFLFCISGFSANRVLVSSYATFQAAVAGIGSTTPTILEIDADTTLSSTTTVTSNIVLDCSFGARIVKSSGTITFNGYGLVNPRSPQACFSGFGTTDISFSSSTIYPPELSANLWDTGDTSLSARAARADDALNGKSARIILYPATNRGASVITASVTVTGGHEIYFTAGTYANTLNIASTGGTGAFIANSNTSFTADSQARIYESAATNSGSIIEPVSLTTALSNIFISNLYIVGAATNGNVAGAASNILTGNVSNGYIRNCTFSATHYYATTIGGYGTSGNYARYFDASDNKYLSVDTQMLSVINGKDISLRRNVFTVANTTGSSGFALIDLEANTPSDRIENIVIESNMFDFRDGSTDYSLVGYAILAQTAQDGSIKNLIVRNNQIFGDDIIPIPTDLSPLASGIYLIGITEGYIYGNTVRSVYGAPIQVIAARYVRVYDNNLIQNTDVVGDSRQIMLSAVADSDVYGNVLSNTHGTPFAQRNGIVETELEFMVTSSGSTITDLNTTPRFFDFFVGLTVTLNNADYTVSAFTSQSSITTSASIGNLTVKTILQSDVNTGTDIITSTAHGFNNGARLRYTEPTSPIGGLIDGRTYFVVNRTANTFQLATTLGGAPIDFTSQGSNTQTFTPVMISKFSNNTYRDNKASGVATEPTGTSIVYARYADFTKRGTLTVDPASIAANTASTQTFTLTGATTGDSLVLNPPSLTSGLLVLQVRVSATNTISVTFFNTTGSAIDEGSASWTYQLSR